MSRPYPRLRSSEKVRRNGASIVVALMAHAVVLLMVVQVVLKPSRIMGWIGIASPVDRSERVVYVQPLPAEPVPVGVPGTPPRADDADPSMTEPPPAAPPLIAPREVPVGIREPGPPPDAPSGGVPDGTGRGSPTQGVVPRYTDPRLWGESPARTGTAQQIRDAQDSGVGRDMRNYQDSLRQAAEARQPGHWTIDRDGRKWGMDPGAVRLGRYFVPTAALVFVPLNVQGNPVAIERDRSMGEIRRQMNIVDRMRATNASLRLQGTEIRARTDRERELRRQREDSLPA